MKTKLILSFLLLTSYFLLSPAQVPQGLNYQAIARDGTGTPLLNQALPVMITIQSDSLGGTIFWEELHSSVTTNAFGAFTLYIGKGARQGASTVPTFNDVNWAVIPKYIKTQIWYGSSWKNMGSSRFWTVPYSMVAGELGGSVDKLVVTGKATSMEEPLFEVKNNTGQTIFAVYNEGVRIYVSDGDAKGAKGGFAIGGFNMAKGVGEYLRVSRDSIRIYLNDEAKVKKGGFAIGGFDQAKGVKQDYLIVDQDSIRMYIKDAAKYNKGGFAIGGFNAGKAPAKQFLSVNSNLTNVSVTDSISGFSVSNIQTGTSQNFMRMNAINYRIGHQSGEKLNQLIGKYNTFFGYKTGYNTTDGRENLFVGYQAGYNNLTASYNVYMGTESGRSNVNGTSNVFIGFGSGKASTTSSNIYIGMKAGYANSAGAGNTYLGYCSGVDDGRPGYTGGSFNTFLGFNSGAKNYTGSGNVYLGAEASGNSRGSGRIFIGYKAGYSTNEDSLLVIESHATASPLVWGDFANNIFRVYGKIEYTEGIGAYSDASLKENINSLNLTLDDLLKLKASTFYWKQGAIKDLEMSHDRQVGLIAQDVEKYFPELVGSTREGLKTVDYTKIGVLILPALKELNDKITYKDTEISSLKDEVTDLKSRLVEIERKLDLAINSNSLDNQ